MHDLTPYKDKPSDEWLSVTEKLIKEHPLGPEAMVAVVKKSWDQIFTSKIGGVIQIGEEIALTPQMIGNFLHVLVAHNLSESSPELWRIEAAAGEKDVVYVPDDYYSLYRPLFFRPLPRRVKIVYG